MLFYKKFIFFLAFLKTLAAASRIEYDFDIQYLYANPDGRMERQVIGINGQFPPPIIEVNENDTVVMNVHNSLDQPTSLHSHGIFQNGTAIMDGTSMVTQCPIPPGQNFTYEFKVQQHGTFWYHSHFGTQYMDGLRAPFIIHSAKNPYSADEDIIITLSDWYHNISTVNLAWYLSKQDLAGFEPVPQSALINDNKNTSFYFAPNKIYRIRLINVSGFASFLFHLDGHDLEVIAVDGVDTEKYPTKSVYLTAAQRVTVLVHTKNTADTNYYMHANMDVSMFNYISSNLIPNTTVPVYYNEDSSKFADIKDADSSKEFDDFNLVPLQVMDAVDPDISFNMTVELGITSDGLNRGMFNRVPFIPSLTPTLYTALTTVKDALNPAIYGPQGNAYICKHLDMVQIVLNNFDNGVHPFHLHGHQFQIVARGINGPYNATGKNDVDWRLKNPCRRDTVQVPGNGFIIIRFRADNPGAWFFHCHIEWHLAAGLAAVIIEAPTVAQKRQSIPQYMTQKCADLGYYSSGNAAGRQGLNVTGAPSGIYLLPSNETA